MSELWPDKPRPTERPMDEWDRDFSDWHTLLGVFAVIGVVATVGGIVWVLKVLL